MTPTRPGPWLSSLLAFLVGAHASAAPLTPDPAAVSQLVNAVSLDVMSEASVDACNDIGAASAAQVRAAWTAWRERHQLPPLRMVVTNVKVQRGSRPLTPDWEQITGPMRERVLNDPAPDKVCAGLAHDFQTPAMDASALYPLARDGANAMVQAGIAWPAGTLPAVTAPPGSQFLQPSQIDALYEQQKKGWDSISLDEAQRKLGYLYVKGRVARWSTRADRFQLMQEEGGRVAGATIHLGFDAEPWVGREVVLRGVATSLSWYSMTLADAAMVVDPSSLKPSPLKHKPLGRPGVLLKRVLAAPGKGGLSDKDVEAVVIWGEANYNNGSSWSEDVRYLFRDGTAYARTVMPPDELNVAASRKLEPGNWSRWRKDGARYEVQDWDDDGKPSGDWQPLKHLPVRPWPQDTKLNGYYEYASFSGSLMLGGTTTRRGFLLTSDGRFERSFGSLSGSGGMAGAAGTVISASSRADGKGSSSSAGGTSNGATAISSQRSQDDGAGRRGRYQLSGYTLVLDYDDGHQQRLLCFPVNANDNKTVYFGNASYSLK